MRRHASICFTLLLILTALLESPSLADEEPACCAATRVRPIVAFDRWDDAHIFVDPQHPEWKQNGAYDAEPFTDGNQNLLYDPGEIFTDTNGNGIYDAEFYHPLLTGYTGARDLGHPLDLELGRLGEPATLGHYWTFRVAPTHGPERSPWHLEDLLVDGLAEYVGAGTRLEYVPAPWPQVCERALREIVGQDASARWDDGCACVLDSAHPDLVTPRIFVMPGADPRFPPARGAERAILVVKMFAVFLEEVNADATVRLRFLKIVNPLPPCPEDELGITLFRTSCR